MGRIFSVTVQKGVNFSSNGWVDNTQAYLNGLGIESEVNCSGDNPEIRIKKGDFQPSFLEGVGGIINVSATIREVDKK